MEAPLIQGTPCPFCGESAFALDDLPLEEAEAYAFLWEEEPDSRLQPRQCSCCGNIQLLLTRL